MKIYYQGHAGAYGHQASILLQKESPENFSDIVGVGSFSQVFEHLDETSVGVVPIENSYAGSIYENFYHILGGDYVIVSEITIEISHCLLAQTKDISQITDVYSHPQALSQCQKLIDQYHWTPHAFGDTAGAAEYVSTQNSPHIASISSSLCSELYNLETLATHIQDQKGNQTRFFVVVHRDWIQKNISLIHIHRVGKTSLTFKTKDIPAALYKCLGAFATRFINLTKIESLPARENQFEYVFWIDFLTPEEDNLAGALEELSAFSKDIRVLGSY